MIGYSKEVIEINILVFSDSHGRSEGMGLALERQVSCPDVIIHLGDGLHDLDALPEQLPSTVLRVRGNCDHFMETAPEESLCALEGHLLLLTHGAKYGVKGGIAALIQRAVEVGADIVLFGHTHRAFSGTIPIGTKIGAVKLQRILYLFNPGSIGHNEDGDGRSFGTITLSHNGIILSHGKI